MTIVELYPSTEELKLDNWKYQQELPDKLDHCEGDFDQEIINEIVL